MIHRSIDLDDDFHANSFLCGEINVFFFSIIRRPLIIIGPAVKSDRSSKFAAETLENVWIAGKAKWPNKENIAEIC